MPISMAGYMFLRKCGCGLLAVIMSIGGAGEKLTMLKQLIIDFKILAVDIFINHRSR